MCLFLVILLASFLESLVSFVGATLVIFNQKRVRRAAHFIVSFAIGALLGAALLELIPEAIAMSSSDLVFPWVLVGMILFFTLEKFLFWYHCHDGTCAVHTYTYLILWGDFLHNFIDGIIIALAFLVDVRLGIITTVAVIFHEIPQEIGDFGILMHGGFSRRKALWYNFLSATSVMIGAVLTYFLGGILEPFLPYALALVAGNFIYLAATDLMPELHESTTFGHSVGQILLIIIGALLVIAPEFIFG
jgi:zinc and cadmium transporter